MTEYDIKRTFCFTLDPLLGRWGASMEISPSSNSQPLLAALSSLGASFDQALATAHTQPLVNELRVLFLGKKGKLTDILKTLGTLAPDERTAVGEAANQLKTRLSQAIDLKLESLQRIEIENTLRRESLDITLPGRGTQSRGHLHPIQQGLDHIVRIFKDMGFDVDEGPQVETDYYNFEALNIPSHHPARDMQDTFYLADGRVLRTHTSPVQIRYMEAHRPPFQMIAPGKVYRRDSDVTHTPMFHQVEGLVVAPNLSMAHLKGVLETFVHAFFGPDVSVRLRPSYFPFTEPSCEVDIQCVLCTGAGCSVCKHTGWLEVMGAGMVHPNVFKSVGYDPETTTGFAFGMGVERLTMLKYKVGDLRLFYDNDPKFLEQF